MSLDKKIKVLLKNNQKMKSRNVEIVNDSTLKFNNFNSSSYELVSINEIYQIKGYKKQSKSITTVGHLATVIGIITIPYIIGIPMVIIARRIKGYQEQVLYNWELKIE